MSKKTAEQVDSARGRWAALRLRRADRSQHVWHPGPLDALLSEDHRARDVWRFVQKQDLSRLLSLVKSTSRSPGAPATDPAVLLALWIYAMIDNVGSARKLERLCEEHIAYRWLLGGLTINHHTLSDFRRLGSELLDEVLARAVATLVKAGVVKGEEITQDGTKIKASAGSGSFRTRESLRALLEECKSHVARVDASAGEETSPGREAARKRALREREERLEAALKAIDQIEDRAQSNVSHKGRKPRTAPRASTTDSDARRMKMGDGGCRPAYNVQFGVDTASRAIVGALVVNQGNDSGLLTPLREDVQRRMSTKVATQIADSGYLAKADIHESEASGTACVVPLGKGRDGKPCTRNPRDTPEVAMWRKRMQTDKAAEQLRRRGGIAETPNGEIKTYRGLGALTVRGTTSAKSMVLLAAIAYNLVHFAPHLT